MTFDDFHTVNESVDELEKLYFKLEKIHDAEKSAWSHSGISGDIESTLEFNIKVLSEVLSQIEEATISLKLISNHTKADEIAIKIQGGLCGNTAAESISVIHSRETRNSKRKS